MTLPLAGQRVVITRAVDQADSLVEGLAQLGAIPIRFPTIQVAPILENRLLDAALSCLESYDWVIFTSVNGVRYVVDRLLALSLPVRALNQARVGAIGAVTGAALTRSGVKVDLIPHDYVAESLFERLNILGSLATQRFLLLGAEAARPTLRESLRERGAAVDEISVYRTLKASPSLAEFKAVRSGVEVVTFTSPLTAAYFSELLREDADRLAVDAVAACIGPVTAHAVAEIGLPFRHRLIAESYTVAGLLSALTS
jgi:uroporphyrinogen III methyltransferase/synthase